MRKSKQQRINEGNALITAIKQDPVLAKEQSWLLRFLNDLVTKFKRGKGGTKRQRELFDEKIASGVPARKVNTHVAQPIVSQMQEAIKIFEPFLGMELYQWEHRVISEMYVKGMRWNLSEKQVKMAEDIVSRAKNLEESGETNTPEQLERIDFGIECSSWYSDNFFYTNVKKAAAIKLAKAKRSKGSALTESEIEALEEACSGAMKKMRAAQKRCEVGSLMKLEVWSPIKQRMEEKCGMICSEPYIKSSRSGVLVDIMVDGTVKSIAYKCTKKYTKKELKAMGAI